MLGRAQQVGVQRAGQRAQVKVELKLGVVTARKVAKGECLVLHWVAVQGLREVKGFGLKVAEGRLPEEEMGLVLVKGLVAKGMERRLLGEEVGMALVQGLVVR